jgi:hypothetical protein
MTLITGRVQVCGDGEKHVRAATRDGPIGVLHMYRLGAGPPGSFCMQL